MLGTLFVVATPIGNLEDLTFRALRTLREVDLIAAEDTRRTAHLLAHYDVRKPTISLREHNEARETPRIVARLLAGESVALVSDAGTPTIADPGARLVRAAHDAGVPVVPIPGASAVVAALSVSGMSGEGFVFMGFPPPKGTARKNWLSRLAAEERIVVFFESPHRIRRTVEEVAGVVSGKRLIKAMRELTKKHEELVITPMIVGQIKEQGEFVVLVDQACRDSAANQPLTADPEPPAMFGYLTESCGVERSVAAELVGLKFSMSAADVMKAFKKNRILAERQRQAGS